MMDYEKTAGEIIENNLYMTLATADGDPWIAPLFYTIDENYNIYFNSAEDSIHTQHIMKNPNVAVAIFDSTQKEGTATGLQIEGKVSLVYEENYKKIIELFHNKKHKMKGKKESPVDYDKYKTGNKKIFKIETLKFYMLDEESWEKNHIDKRREVKLK